VIASGVAWTVHIATAGSTTVSFACFRREDRDPWMLGDAVAALLAAGAERIDRPHAAGSGRGIPILHTQRLRLQRCDIELHAVHCASGDDELTLTLPPWDELCNDLDTEDALWEACDLVAEQCSVRAGCIGDGEAFSLGDVRSMLRRHAGLLLQEAEAREVPATVAALHRVLPRSGLHLILR